ncbi:MAG TPA: enoyl-CoA hydratase-related protein, partial [Actinomycetota bacterium]|nr:enoyl-CoA hydratase-related protein [Actinomycetota bacterium]
SRLPVIGRINGLALAGGFGLVLACDLVVAVDEAEFGTPEIDVGLWPFMITALIHRSVPRRPAFEMMLTGRRITAEEGRQLGFVNRVASRAELDSAVSELAEQIASKSPLIVELGKRSFYKADGLPFDAALEYLAGMLTLCLESEDTVEGVTAFLQKRPPEWKGR